MISVTYTQQRYREPLITVSKHVDLFQNTTTSIHLSLSEAEALLQDLKVWLEAAATDRDSNLDSVCDDDDYGIFSDES